MQIRYSGSKNTPWYGCTRNSSDYGDPLCQSLSGAALDDLGLPNRFYVAAQPAALEASLAAVADIERERAELMRQWLLKLERADQTLIGHPGNTSGASRRTGWWPANWNAVGRKP